MQFLRTGNLTESHGWRFLRAKPLPAQKPLCSITEGDPQPQVAGILPGMGSSLPPQGHPSHCWAAWTSRSYHFIFSSKSAFPKIPFTDLSPIFRKFYKSAGAWGSRDEMRVCPHAQGAADHSGGRTRVRGDRGSGGGIMMVLGRCPNLPASWSNISSPGPLEMLWCWSDLGLNSSVILYQL